jgi:hypothetical protein
MNNLNVMISPLQSVPKVSRFQKRPVIRKTIRSNPFARSNFKSSKKLRKFRKTPVYRPAHKVCDCPRTPKSGQDSPI